MLAASMDAVRGSAKLVADPSLTQCQHGLRCFRYMLNRCKLPLLLSPRAYSRVPVRRTLNIKRQTPASASLGRRPRISSDGQSVHDVGHIDGASGSSEARKHTFPKTSPEKQTITSKGKEQDVPSRVKRMLRTVPQAVAIITARKPDVQDHKLATVGLLVSSLNTVSLEPDVILSFNMRNDSTTYMAILASRKFTVTFPRNNLHGARLCKYFTGSNATPPLTKAGLCTLSSGSPSYPHVPALWQLNLKQLKIDGTVYPHESGVAFAWHCDFISTMPVGDHVIVTGRLNPAGLRSIFGQGFGDDHVFATSDTTLSYVHGRYAHEYQGTGLGGIWKWDDRSTHPRGQTPETEATAYLFYRKRLALIDDMLSGMHAKQNQMLAPISRTQLLAYKILYGHKLRALYALSSDCDSGAPDHSRGSYLAVRPSYRDRLHRMVIEQYESIEKLLEQGLLIGISLTSVSKHFLPTFSPTSDSLDKALSALRVLQEALLDAEQSLTEERQPGSSLTHTLPGPLHEQSSFENNAVAYPDEEDMLSVESDVTPDDLFTEHHPKFDSSADRPPTQKSIYVSDTAPVTPSTKRMPTTHLSSIGLPNKGEPVSDLAPIEPVADIKVGYT